MNRLSFSKFRVKSSNSYCKSCQGRGVRPHSPGWLQNSDVPTSVYFDGPCFRCRVAEFETFVRASSVCNGYVEAIIEAYRRKRERS